MTLVRHQCGSTFVFVFRSSSLRLPCIKKVPLYYRKNFYTPVCPVSDQPACARSLISIESGDGGAAQEATSERETAAVERTAACIAGCRLEDLFADSKFLRAEVHSNAAGSCCLEVFKSPFNGSGRRALLGIAESP